MLLKSYIKLFHLIVIIYGKIFFLSIESNSTLMNLIYFQNVSFQSRTSDSMAKYSDGVAIQQSMLENDNIAILLKGYFGGHGHTEAVNYKTSSMYYIERYLYLTH